ncbi:hypothetical protein [Aquipseudomonas alcaligenes]|uniref:hypothetical protein n=1 Tax=Aquipseudomonas alcaligenes TaxID=43263 RepID=UPI0011158405|nr:hypothetical protein [Pseudomonas alcaligenes]
MYLREQEYQSLGLEVRWLDKAHAENAYKYAVQFTSKEKYDLNENAVKNIEHLNIESYSVAEHWISHRISSAGTVQVVYSDSEVCVINAAIFISKWKDIFCPSRDDAIILHNNSHTVLFYCHEEELEVGERNA